MANNLAHVRVKPTIQYGPKLALILTVMTQCKWNMMGLNYPFNSWLTQLKINKHIPIHILDLTRIDINFGTKWGDITMTVMTQSKCEGPKSYPEQLLKIIEYQYAHPPPTYWILPQKILDGLNLRLYHRPNLGNFVFRIPILNPQWMALPTS